MTRAGGPGVLLLSGGHDRGCVRREPWYPVPAEPLEIHPPGSFGSAGPTIRYGSLWLGTPIPLGPHETDADPLNPACSHVLAWEDAEWQQHLSYEHEAHPPCALPLHGSGTWELFTLEDWEDGPYFDGGLGGSPLDDVRTLEELVRRELDEPCALRLRSYSWMVDGTDVAVTWPCYEVFTTGEDVWRAGVPGS